MIRRFKEMIGSIITKGTALLSGAHASVSMFQDKIAAKAVGFVQSLGIDLS